MINKINLYSNSKYFAPTGIFLSAFIYGIIWYPYRLLDQGGLSGIIATFLTDTIALIFGISILFNSLKNTIKSKEFIIDKYLILLMLTSGWANLGCVLGIVEGNVVRVMLLFYLSPVWTMIFARFMLHEKLNFQNIVMIFVSVIGAMIMLYQPNAGIPIPTNHAEWYGLTAGIAFAWANVLSRKIQHCPVEFKSLTIWIGVIILAIIGLCVTDTSQIRFESLHEAYYWQLIVIAGVGIAIASLALQMGLSLVPANQASMILLCELVITALSTYLLANEIMGLKEWIGGSLIVGVSILMNRSEH